MYTNEWAVQILGNSQTADQIAARHGYTNMGALSGLDDIYRFQRRAIPRRVTRSDHYRTMRLVTDPKVTWAEHQVVRVRVKRSFAMPRDRNWPDQWYFVSEVLLYLPVCL
jgi:hypothetical protein